MLNLPHYLFSNVRDTLLLKFDMYVLIPAHHGKGIVDALGHQNLVEINDAVVEGGGTGTKVQLPHSGKPFPLLGCDLLSVGLEIILPAKQSFVVMES